MVFTKSDGVEGWLPTGFLQVWGVVVWGKACHLKPCAWPNLFSVPCPQNAPGEYSVCIWQELRVIALRLRIGWKRGTSFSYLRPKK